jgi:hypothetical protein
VTAVAVAVSIVAGTALLVWLLRPGPPAVFGNVGGGGLLNRQPRASWLVVLTAVAVGGFAWWVLRRRRSTRRRPLLLGLGSLVLVGGAVAAGFLWPGGLLRRYAPTPQVDLDEIGDLTSTTTAPGGATTTSGTGTATTGPPTTPGTTAPAAVPTTAPSATGSP